MTTSIAVPAAVSSAGHSAVRELFGGVADTVAVLSTATRIGDAVERRGMTVTSYCSVSETPPLLLVCLNRSAATLAFVLASSAFALNVLPASGACVADAFAGRRPAGERFSAGDWVDVQGLPVLRSAVAWGICEVVEVMEGGDHAILLGSLTHVHRGTGSPLMRYQHRYAALDPRCSGR